MPKVSVIVTAYNIENYIGQCLDDMLAQTIEDIEIIIVDDGSTDATPRIIREYAQKDSRLRPILFEKNTIGGVATAANAGIDAATGDYIGFADGDDLYDPKMFDRLHAAAVAHAADLAMCDYYLLDESDGELKEPADAARWRAYPEEIAFDLDDMARRELLRFVSVPWRKIYRRDLVERINLRFPVGDYFFEDNPFHWAAILGGERIVMMPEKLCRHRVARVGQTMATMDSRLLRIFHHHDNIRDWLRMNRLSEAYSMELLRWTGNQLSWVSQRAEGPVLRELYDTLRPIIEQYSREIIDKFGSENGHGRTYLMLVALKAGGFSDFTRAARLGSNGSPAPVRLSGPLISRGLHHLKHSGIRETMRMTARYMGDRNKAKSIPARRKAGAEKGTSSDDDLMAAMIVLQYDIRRLCAEVAALQRRTDPLLPEDDSYGGEVSATDDHHITPSSRKASQSPAASASRTISKKKVSW